jgi:hypothetical protein
MLRCYAKTPFNTTRTTCDLDSYDIADEERARPGIECIRQLPANSLAMRQCLPASCHSQTHISSQQIALLN